MNIVQSTFHGVIIKVRYKCGHLETERSKDDKETALRKRLAGVSDCHVCATNKQLYAQQQPTRITADPASVQLAARRREVMDMLASKINGMRTR